MKKAGLYIHIPFCKKKCIYCDFYSITKKENQIPLFTKCLLKEIDFYKQYSGKWKFDTIFFGGGTPSLLPAKYLEKILQKLHDTFNISKIEEITLEANPDDAPIQYLKDIRKLGINRLSIGFQSLNDKHLKSLSRIHSSKDCIKTFKNARKAGFDNINTDMIFNIPDLTSKEWIDNLKILVNLEPEHISAYSLTVENGTVLFNLVKDKKVVMPVKEIDINQFLITKDLLHKNGYFQYEISNYSKDKKECHHNLHYWNLDPYLAFGPSAHGYDGNNRWWNTSSLDTYIKMIAQHEKPISGSETLSQTDHNNEVVFNGLRTREGIQLQKMDSSKDYQHQMNSAIKKWKDRLDVTKYSIRLKFDSYKYADEIASDMMQT